MKKLLVLALLLASAAARADYAYGPFNTWRLIDNHNIILEGAGKFLVKLPYCFVNGASSVHVLSDQLGPYDGKILVDGTICDVTEVHRL